LRIRAAAVADAAQRARVAAIVAQHVSDSWFERISTP
jgi:hypothetical protein